MSKHPRRIQLSSSPAKLALVFVCEKCGKRAGGDKHSSRELAGLLKRRIKNEFAKGDMRIVLTSCMDLCPDNAIAVSVQPSDTSMAATFWEVDVDNLQEASDELAGSIFKALRDER